MDSSALVVAFSDSPALRETLAVLLEHHCHLRFANTHGALPTQPIPDVAVVAAPRSTRLLQTLIDRWPRMPIVAVHLPHDVTASGSARLAEVHSVPLDAQAIRAAVLERLPERSTDPWARTVAVIADSLRDELHYSCVALRTFAAMQAGSPGPDTYAIVAAVIREQAVSVERTVADLLHFQRRPRQGAVSTDFIAELCHYLSQPQQPGSDRGISCQCNFEGVTSSIAGPFHLIPSVSGFIRTHLRRRSAAAVVTVFARRDGVSLTYPVHTPRRSAAHSWPLLLAALALQPWGWNVTATVVGTEETVRLCGAA